LFIYFPAISISCMKPRSSCRHWMNSKVLLTLNICYDTDASEKLKFKGTRHKHFISLPTNTHFRVQKRTLNFSFMMDLSQPYVAVSFRHTNREFIPIIFHHSHLQTYTRLTTTELYMLLNRLWIVVGPISCRICAYFHHTTWAFGC